MQKEASFEREGVNADTNTVDCLAKQLQRINNPNNKHKTLQYWPGSFRCFTEEYSFTKIRGCSFAEAETATKKCTSAPGSTAQSPTAASSFVNALCVTSYAIYALSPICEVSGPSQSHIAMASRHEYVLQQSKPTSRLVRAEPAFQSPSFNIRGALTTMANNLSFLLCVFVALFSLSASSVAASNHALSQRQAQAQPPLVNFQVSEPVLTPKGPSDEHGCVYTQELMSHVFGISYGVPFIGSTHPALQPEVWLLIYLQETILPRHATSTELL